MAKRGRPPADIPFDTGPISDALRRAVEASGISKYALAKDVGLSKGQFYRFMKGERTLSQGALNRLASQLGVRVVLPEYEPLSATESRDSAGSPTSGAEAESISSEIAAPDSLLQKLASLDATIDEEFASFQRRLAGHEAGPCEEGTGVWDRFTRWWRPSAAKGDVGLGESPTNSTVDGPASNLSLNRRVSLAGADPRIKDLLDDLRSSLKMRVCQTLGVSPTDIHGERPNDQGAVMPLTRPVQAEPTAAVSEMGHRQAEVGPSLPGASSSDLSMSAAEATDQADPDGSGVAATSPGHAMVESGHRSVDEGPGGAEVVLASESVPDGIKHRPAEESKRAEEVPLVGSEPDRQPTPEGETRAAASASEAGTTDPARLAAGSMPIRIKPQGKWADLAAQRKERMKRIRAIGRSVGRGVKPDPNVQPVAPMPEPEEDPDEDTDDAIDSSSNNYTHLNVNAAVSTRQSPSGPRNAPWAADIRDYLEDKHTSPYLQELPGFSENSTEGNARREVSDRDDAGDGEADVGSRATNDDSHGNQESANRSDVATGSTPENGGPRSLDEATDSSMVIPPERRSGEPTDLLARLLISRRPRPPEPPEPRTEEQDAAEWVQVLTTESFRNPPRSHRSYVQHGQFSAKEINKLLEYIDNPEIHRLALRYKKRGRRPVERAKFHAFFEQVRYNNAEGPTILARSDVYERYLEVARRLYDHGHMERLARKIASADLDLEGQALTRRLYFRLKGLGIYDGIHRSYLVEGKYVERPNRTVINGRTFISRREPKKPRP